MTLHHLLVISGLWGTGFGLALLLRYGAGVQILFALSAVLLFAWPTMRVLKMRPIFTRCPLCSQASSATLSEYSETQIRAVCTHCKGVYYLPRGQNRESLTWHPLEVHDSQGCVIAEARWPYFVLIWRRIPQTWEGSSPLEHTRENIEYFGSSLNEALDLSRVGTLQFEHGMPGFDRVERYMTATRYRNLTKLGHLWIEVNEYLSYGIFLDPRADCPPLEQVQKRLQEVADAALAGTTVDKLVAILEADFPGYSQGPDHLSGIPK